MRSGFCTVTKRNVKVLQEPYTDPYVRFCERADAAPDQRSVTLLDVLTLYEHRCAVCDYDLRLGNTHIGLEAAHIMWHQAGGPDMEENGLALCVLHHKLFDLGAFTLSERLVITISEQAHGNHRFDDCLLSFHGQRIRQPQDPRCTPKRSYILWHQRQVFRGLARYVPSGSGMVSPEHYVAEGSDTGYVARSKE